MDKKIIMLVGGGESSVFMYNGLKNIFNISKVIVEENPDKYKIFKRRLKRLGYLDVFGQVLFQLSVPYILKKTSQKRIGKLKSIYKLDSTPITKDIVYNVSSVNSVECIEFIIKEKPDFIIVNGTRIISNKVLNSINATFVNTHAGITPKYRGVHGGYWALVNDDKSNCGVTVHLVDSGIDTGSVLYQSKIYPKKSDNFTTYTYHQIGEGIILMKQAINDFMNNQLNETISNGLESKLYYHPTIWTYLYKRITKGVK
mgnify:CR=1 FL=1